MFTLSLAIDDEREVGEDDEHDIESFEPREDAPKFIEPTGQPFDLGSSLVHGPVVFPPRDAILLRRKEQDKPRFEHSHRVKDKLKAGLVRAKEIEVWTDYHCAPAH